MISVKRSSLARLAVAISLTAGMTFQAAAEWKPETNVEYFIPAGPGGAVDTYGRIMGKIMDDKKLLKGNQLIVHNKPGGAGMIATQELVRRPGNGHVFSLFNICSTMSTVRGDVRYDREEDFAGVCVLSKWARGIAVSAVSPGRTGRDLVEALKKAHAS